MQAQTTFCLDFAQGQISLALFCFVSYAIDQSLSNTIVRISIIGAILNNDSFRSFPIPICAENQPPWTKLKKNHLNKTAHEKLVCSLTVHTLAASIIYILPVRNWNFQLNTTILKDTLRSCPQIHPTLYFHSEITLTNRSAIKSDKREHEQKAKVRCKRKVGIKTDHLTYNPSFAISVNNVNNNFVDSDSNVTILIMTASWVINHYDLRECYDDPSPSDANVAILFSIEPCLPNSPDPSPPFACFVCHVGSYDLLMLGSWVRRGICQSAVKFLKFQFYPKNA